jgi:hypothetical protein
MNKFNLLCTALLNATGEKELGSKLNERSPFSCDLMNQICPEKIDEYKKFFEDAFNISRDRCIWPHQIYGDDWDSYTSEQQQTCRIMTMWIFFNQPWRQIND